MGSIIVSGGECIPPPVRQKLRFPSPLLHADSRFCIMLDGICRVRTRFCIRVSQFLQDRRAVLQEVGPILQSGRHVLQGRRTVLQGRKAVLQGRRAVLQGRKAVLQGRIPLRRALQLNPRYKNSRPPSHHQSTRPSRLALPTESIASVVMEHRDRVGGVLF